MPAPIGRPGIAPTPSTTTPSTTTPSTATPATTGPQAPAAPAAVDRSRLERLTDRVEVGADKLKGKAVSVALNELASDHSVGTSLSLGAVSGNLKLSEQVALKDTKSFTSLVAGDRRRLAHTQSNPDAVWVKAKALVGTSAGLPLGAGASLGLSGSVEVTSVMAHTVDGGRDALTAVKEQAKSLVLPLDAEGLKGLNAAPGSEWLFRGTLGASAGIGVGSSATIGGDIVSGNLHAGVSVGASASAVYTKNVKVLEDGKVFVQVSKLDSRSVSGALGVSAKLDLDVEDAASDALGGGVGGDLGGRAADAAGGTVERYARINASANGNVTWHSKELGAAVLDLNTAHGRQAYDLIVRSPPDEAAAYIQRSGLGVTYAEVGRTTTTGVGLQLGSTNLLSTSTLRGTSTGVLEEPGSTTLLAQADYGRSVGGVLPRLMMGEERKVSVRAGQVTRNGVAEQAVLMRLEVMDPKLKPAELGQLERFATHLGTPFNAVPQAQGNKDLGKATWDAQVALTQGHIEAFRGRTDDDVRLAFATALKDIDGTQSLPGWITDKRAFERLSSDYTFANHGDGGNERFDLSRDYKKETGRDLDADIDSHRAINAIVKQTGKARGKPVEQWGGLLEAMGKQSSTDVRAALLAMKRLSGAEVVTLALDAGGVKASGQPQTAAPRSMAEVVGPVIAPPA